MPSQSKIIYAANRFLREKGVSLELNKDGVCAGLASIYIKYFLQGKENDYFILCKKLANLPKDYQSGNDEKLDFFIQEVEIAFNPAKYIKGSIQTDVEKTIFIDGKPVKNEFNLGLVDSQKEWAKLLEDIRSNNRACFVGSNGHAIALSFQNDEFVVADSNYDLDEADDLPNKKTFHTAAEVITELTKQFYYNRKDNVGFQLRVFAHPDTKDHPKYPQKSQIWSQRLKDQQDFSRAIAKNDQMTTAYFAAGANDLETLRYLLKNNALEPELLNYIIYCHRDDIVYQYFFLQNGSTQLKLLHTVAFKGNTELLIRMLQYIKTAYLNDDNSLDYFVNAINGAPSLLEQAVLSNNETTLAAVLNLYKEYRINPLDAPGFSWLNLVQKATEQGNTQMLKQLVKELQALSTQRIIEYIAIAAVNNHNSALDFWLGRLPVEFDASQANLINKAMIKKISSLNLKKLINHHFSISLDLLEEALYSNYPTLFALCLGPLDKDWGLFYKQMIAQNLRENIDLFTKKDGINAFQILARFGENKLLKRLLPEQIGGLTTVEKEELLQFSYRAGNKELTIFLCTSGCETTISNKITHLKIAIEDNDRDVIDAVLASGIAEPEMFSKDNRDLVCELMSLGKFHFIMHYWNQLEEDKKYKFLGLAIQFSNKDLINFIAKKNIDISIQFLRNHILYAYKNNNFSSLENLNSLYTFIDPEILREFWSDLNIKNHDALIFCLYYALRRQQFNLAELIGEYLTTDDCLKLLVEAEKRENAETVDFIIRHHSHLFTKQFYLNLEEGKHYQLLQKCLHKKKPMEDKLCRSLLDSAVTRNDAEIIYLLRSTINEAYRAEGLALYKALINNNVDGAFSLLLNGANLSEHSLIPMLYNQILKSGHTRLLFIASANRNFAEYFAQKIQEDLDAVLTKNSHEFIELVVKKIDIQPYFNLLLQRAIERDNVLLFRVLQQSMDLGEDNSQQLFTQACKNQSLSIANELLALSPSFDKTETQRLLKLLFGQRDAHQIYDLVYKKALNRLYLFVKEHNYGNPLGLIHQSIESIILDPGFEKKSNLKAFLIEKALDAGDKKKLCMLLKQLQHKIPLNEGGLTLFTNNLHQPILLRKLLEHYSLMDVLEAAYDQQEWYAIFVLLKNKTTDEIPPAFLEKLAPQAEKILDAVQEKAKLELEIDKRQELNALLNSEVPYSLNQLFKNLPLKIKQVVMTLQDSMKNENINLNRQFYCYDLYDDLVSTSEHIEHIKPQVDDFFLTQGSKPIADLINDVQMRESLLTISSYFDNYHLTPHYFEQRDQLFDLFDALLDFQQKEAESQKEMGEQKKIEELKRQQAEKRKLLDQQREEAERRNAEEHQRLQEELRQLQAQKAREEELQKLQEQKRLQEEAQRQQREKELNELAERQRILEEKRELLAQQQRERLNPLNDQKKLLSTLTEGSQGEDEGVQKDTTSQESKIHDSLQLLITAVKQAPKETPKLPFFHYSKKEHKEAAMSFILAIKHPDRLIGKTQAKILNQGWLHDCIFAVLNEHQYEISQQLGRKKKPIHTVKELINTLNERAPISTLIRTLQNYKKLYANNEEQNAWSLFDKIKQRDKMLAVDNLISHLEGKSVYVSRNNIVALKHGHLGEILTDFFNDLGFPLAKATGSKSLIMNVEQLLKATAVPELQKMYS